MPLPPKRDGCRFETPFFSSNRERRRWPWLAAALAGIFATLWQALMLTGALGERKELAGAIFFVLLIVVTVVAA